MIALENAFLCYHLNQEPVKIGHNPTPFFGNNKVCAVKPWLHAGCKVWLYCVLRQQDCNLCLQDRSIFVQHRDEPNAPELGVTWSELNCVADSDGPSEPVRRLGSTTQAPGDRVSGTRGITDIPAVGQRGRPEGLDPEGVSECALLGPSERGNCSFLETFGVTELKLNKRLYSQMLCK